METPLSTEEKKIQLRNDRIQFLTDIITASSRYERLLANSDFIAVMNDLQNVVKNHDDEIQGYLQAYSLTSSFFKKMRLAEVLGQHQLRKSQILDAINYPKMIVEKAKEARESLAKLKEQEKETNHV